MSSDEFLTIKEIRTALDAAGIPEPEDIGISGGPVLSAPEEWRFADQLGEDSCGYVLTMLQAWPSDPPMGGQRHRTVIAKATRLAAFWRSGCITSDDYYRGGQILDEWLSDRREATSDEVSNAMQDGIGIIAAKTDEDLLSEIGHDPDHPYGREGEAGLVLDGRPNLTVHEGGRQGGTAPVLDDGDAPEEADDLQEVLEQRDADYVDLGELNEKPHQSRRTVGSSDDGSADPVTDTRGAMLAEVDKLAAKLRRNGIEPGPGLIKQLATATERKLVDEAGRRFARIISEPPAGEFDAGTLRDILARPAEPAHRVDGLIPWSASTLISAQHKVGKTTLMINLVESLLTGRPFLGRFETIPIEGAVGFLNYEVSAAQISRWSDARGVDPDRLFLVNLRGRRNPLSHPEDRVRLAKLLKSREVETLIVDPFSVAYDGESQNDAGEVNAWLVRLADFARTEIGALDLILSAHNGWNGERVRGSSALLGWPDSTINMVRDEDTGGRFISAEGRDVWLEEEHLFWDEDQRSLSVTGHGSRKVARTGLRNELLDRAVTEAVEAEPGLKMVELRERLRSAGVAFQKGEESNTVARLEAAEVIRSEPGKQRAKHLYPVDAVIIEEPPTVSEEVLKADFDDESPQTPQSPQVAPKHPAGATQDHHHKVAPHLLEGGATVGCESGVWGEAESEHPNGATDDQTEDLMQAWPVAIRPALPVTVGHSPRTAETGDAYPVGANPAWHVRFLADPPVAEQCEQCGGQLRSFDSTGLFRDCPTCYPDTFKRGTR